MHSLISTKRTLLSTCYFRYFCLPRMPIFTFPPRLFVRMERYFLRLKRRLSIIPHLQQFRILISKRYSFLIAYCHNHRTPSNLNYTINKSRLKLTLVTAMAPVEVLWLLFQKIRTFPPTAGSYPIPASGIAYPLWSAPWLARFSLPACGETPPP